MSCTAMVSLMPALSLLTILPVWTIGITFMADAALVTPITPICSMC